MKVNGVRPLRSPNPLQNPRTFVLPSAPNPPESLQLFADGLLQYPGVDFELKGDAICYLHEPFDQDRQIAWYEDAQ